MIQLGKIKKVVIIIFIIFVILIGITIFLIFQKKSSKDKLVFSECQEIKEKKERRLCFDNHYMTKAVLERNINWCKKIKDLEYKDHCFGTLAVDLNDLTICQFIKEALWKSLCYRDLARKNKDKSICENEKNPFLKKKCYALTELAIVLEEKNPKRCLDVPDVSDARNVCIWTFVALKEKDGLKICQEIPPGVDQDRCFSWYYLNQGLQEKNKEFCEKIILEDFKKVCLVFLKEIQEGKLSENYYLDSDKDRIDDLNELGLNTSPFDPDTDKDGLSDGEESFDYFLNPLSKDTDGDGILDKEEVKTKKKLLF